MEFITINNTKYPFAFTYRVFKIALQNIPKDNTSVIGGVDMVEHTTAAAITAGYKKGGQPDLMTHDMLLDLFDDDQKAFAVASGMVTKAMEKYQSGTEDKPKKGAKK